MREVGDPWECLNLIDAIQRLGIDYHFQEEIEAVLQRQYVLFNEVQFNQETFDLHKAALLFRLFRQQGYLVSAGSYSILKYNNSKAFLSVFHVHFLKCIWIINTVLSRLFYF